MCGIAGVYFATPDLPAGIAQRMNSAQKHRGPDAEGVFSCRGARIGHVRLSIIDLSEGGAQPMTDETGRYVISFNGEIFNYRELRIELEADGVKFRSQSDTEVLLRLLIQQGASAISKLRGQFAFALWDQEQQRLLCARDRFGEKPFYWAQTPGGELVIASEAKALFASGLVEKQIDPTSIHCAIALLYPPPGRSAFKGIQTLNPGHVLEAEEDRIEVSPFWRPQIASEEQAGTEKSGEIAEETLRLLRQSVQRQMVADVPVGAFLSGGLDSSSIVALAAPYASDRLMTFAAGFGDLINELPYAREVADLYQTDHHELQMDMDVGALLPQIVDLFDEPFPDSSALPTWCLAQFTRQHCKVALSGDGGDEIFGGYSWYRRFLSGEPGRLQQITSRSLKALSAVLGKAGAVKLAGKLRPWVSQANEDELRSRFPDPIQRYLAAASDTERMITAGLRVRGSDISTVAEMTSELSGFPFHSKQDDFSKVTEVDVQNYLPGDILVKVDRTTMAHGLESRSPFLDPDFADFVLGLHPADRVPAAMLKALLKNACGGLWPDSLLSRGKQGFGAPLGAWLRRPAVIELLQKVKHKDSALRHWMPDATPELFERARPHFAWVLLTTGLWLEKHSS